MPIDSDKYVYHWKHINHTTVTPFSIISRYWDSAGWWNPIAKDIYPSTLQIQYRSCIVNDLATQVATTSISIMWCSFCGIIRLHSIPEGLITINCDHAANTLQPVLIFRASPSDWVWTVQPGQIAREISWHKLGETRDVNRYSASSWKRATCIVPWVFFQLVYFCNMFVSGDNVNNANNCDASRNSVNYWPSFYIDRLHISHDAPVPYGTTHQFVTVHISVTKRCIVGHLSNALWDFLDGSVPLIFTRSIALRIL